MSVRSPWSSRLVRRRRASDVPAPPGDADVQHRRVDRGAARGRVVEHRPPQQRRCSGRAAVPAQSASTSAVARPRRTARSTPRRPQAPAGAPVRYGAGGARSPTCPAAREQGGSDADRRGGLRPQAGGRGRPGRVDRRGPAAPGRARGRQLPPRRHRLRRRTPRRRPSASWTPSARRSRAPASSTTIRHAGARLRARRGPAQHRRGESAPS